MVDRIPRSKRIPQSKLEETAIKELKSEWKMMDKWKMSKDMTKRQLAMHKTFANGPNFFGCRSSRKQRVP